MKKCDFCIYSGCTDRNEQVCTKRLLYVEELEKEYPCSYFTINVSRTQKVVFIGLAIAWVALVLLGTLLN